MRISKQNIATSLAILFHVCGAIGILYTPYKDWFIANTPLNLCLMSLLLLWTHEDKNLSFYFFFATAFLVGMGTEIIGVNTGRLFGSYQYGIVLGPRFNGVPFLIGLNWFVIVFCSSAVMHKVHDWLRRSTGNTEVPVSARLLNWSLLLDGALLATFFDWIMEPVAMKLGFWQWKNGEVPAYNYLCWFAISFILLMIMRMMRFPKQNHFAVQLFIIQFLFFLTLRTFLV